MAESSYLNSLRNFRNSYRTDFPRGLNVDQVAQTFLDNNGWEVLRKVAKLTLMNQERVV